MSGVGILCYASKTTKGASDRARAQPRLTGRAAKDAAMVKMRELAERGGYTNWGHVLTACETLHPEDTSLRIWASAHDRDAIDLICVRRSRTQERSRR